MSGYVYADTDNDGIRDAGEQGLSGVTVRVIPVDTLAPQQTIILSTNAQGFYEATNLSPGTYRIVEAQQPAAYLDGLDTAGTVAGVPRGTAVNPGDNIEDIFLSGGARGVDYNFGEILPASLHGSVHLSDSDGNCFVTECTYEVLSGVTIKLLDGRGQVVAETQTDASGNYAFTRLTPGLYSIIEITPAGMIDAGAHAGTVGTSERGRVVDANTIGDIQLGAGDQGFEYDFCEHLPSSLAGYVYHDRNNNGLRESGEEAIAGVIVTLYQQDGSQLAVTQTNAQGRYEFTALSAGLYRLVESQPSDWLDGKDSTGTVDGAPSGTVAGNDILQVGQLRWGATGVDFNFGELLPGTLQGVVYADIDRDCVFDPDEPPIAGVKIELLDERGSVVSTTNTSASGEYRFERLVPGQYAVRETQPDGYFQGSQRAGSHGGNASVADLITQIPVGSGQHLTDYDFCEILPGSISGIVFVDPNQNGNWDSGETRLAGVTVQLLDATGSVVATAQTSTVGYYEFKNLRPGEFGVHELQPTEYFHGGQWAGSHGGNDSVDDFITAITIGAGQNLTEYNFSEIPASSLAGIVYVATSDVCTATPDRPLSGVTLELLNEQGQVLRTTRTGQDGRYQFDRLPPGQYTVRESQPAGYFQGGQCAGSGGGIDTVPDVISAIVLPAGVQLVDYNFHEIPPGSLSGYVFQDGPVIRTNSGTLPGNLADIRDGRRTPDDRPIAGVVVELRDGVTGIPIVANQALPGTYASGPVRTVTDANGFYQFVGLPPGSYAVYEVHPAQYIDGIDTAGTHVGDSLQWRFACAAGPEESAGEGPRPRCDRADPITRGPVLAGKQLQRSARRADSAACRATADESTGAELVCVGRAAAPALEPGTDRCAAQHFHDPGPRCRRDHADDVALERGGRRKPAERNAERGSIARPVANGVASESHAVDLRGHATRLLDHERRCGPRDGRRAGPHVRHPRRVARERRFQWRRHRRSGTLPRRPVVHRPQPQRTLG